MRANSEHFKKVFLFLLFLLVSPSYSVCVFAQHNDLENLSNGVGRDRPFFPSGMHGQVETKIDGLSDEASRIVLFQLVNALFMPGDNFLLKDEYPQYIQDPVADVRRSINAYRSGLLSGWSYTLKHFAKCKQDLFENKGWSYDEYFTKISGIVAEYGGVTDSLTFDEHSYVRRFGELSPNFLYGYREERDVASSLVVKAIRKIDEMASNITRREDLSPEAKKTGLSNALKGIPELEAVMFLNEIIRLKEKRDADIVKQPEPTVR